MGMVEDGQKNPYGNGFCAHPEVDLDLAKNIHEGMARWDNDIINWHNVNLAQGFREPGVYYHMGIGYTTGAVPKAARVILASMRERAVRRNLDMIARVKEETVQKLCMVQIRREEEVQKIEEKRRQDYIMSRGEDTPAPATIRNSPLRSL